MNSSQRSLSSLVLLCSLAAACGDDAPDPADTGVDTTDAATDADVDATDPDVDATDPDVDATDVTDAWADTDVGADADAEGDADVEDPDCPRWWTVVEPTPDGPGAGTDGRDTTEYDAGASAGLVRTGDGGFAGIYATCRTGDWVLENEFLRACIADERSMTQMLFDGGNLVDIELRDAPGNDELYYAVTASGLLNQGADQVELVADGSDGGDAVIRVTGPDTLMMFVAATIGSLAPSVDVDIVTEYRLQPGATAIELTTWLSKADGQRTVVRMGDLIAGGDTTNGWAPGSGFTIPAASSAVPFFASIGETHSVGITSPELTLQTLTLPEIEIPFGSVTSAVGLLCPDDTASFRRWLTVGAGDTWTLRQSLASHLPDVEESSVLFDGWADHYEVRDSGGLAVDVVRVDGPLDWTLPDGDYSATPLNWPTDDPPVVSFTVPGEPVVLPAPQLGRVNVSVVDDLGAPLSAEVRFVGDVQERIYAMQAGSSVDLPPGPYFVWAWRGIEYSYWQGTVQVELDGEVSVSPVLIHEVDMQNWVGGDLHQHGTPSPDSRVSLIDRVRSNLGAGVDFIAPSDHDALGDYAGAIAELGVGDQLHLLLGEELSPGVGHINLFPRTFDRQAPSAGAIPLGERAEGSRELVLPSSGELVETARAAGVTFVQLNHPRGSLAHFSATRYDPVAGPDANDAPNWFDDFDAIEVYNTPNTFCVGLQDWFSLLNHGRVITGTGNSDTHDLDPPAGWPRNYVRSRRDDPGELADSVLLDGLLALQSTVSGGIFVEFDGGVLPGDTIELIGGGPLTLPVRVRAPSWADVDQVRVYINGVVAAVRPFEREVGEIGEIAETLDEAIEFELEIAQDSQVVVVAYSHTPLQVVAPGKRPFGFTNPVFVDLDGDGWTPPGVPNSDALPLPSGLPNCGE